MSIVLRQNNPIEGKKNNKEKQIYLEEAGKIE
jgi:hypothetical protein